jgi:threonine aldolase
VRRPSRGKVHVDASRLVARTAGSVEVEQGGDVLPTDANLVFVSLPEEVERGLRERGWGFHVPGHPDWRMARFVTAFDTDVELIDALVADVAEVSSA